MIMDLSSIVTARCKFARRISHGACTAHRHDVINYVTLQRRPGRCPADARCSRVHPLAQSHPPEFRDLRTVDGTVHGDRKVAVHFPRPLLALQSNCNLSFIIRTDGRRSRRREYNTRSVCHDVWVCVGMYVSMMKRKPLIEMT